MLLRATLILGPSVVMPRLASFLIVLLLAHRLPPGPFGLYALTVLTGESIDMAASGWIRLALLRLDIAAPGGWRTSFVRSCLLSAISTMVGFLAAAAAGQVLAPDAFMPFVVAVAAYLAANGLLRLGLAMLQLRQHNAAYSRIETLRAVTQILGVLFLIGQQGAALTFLSTSLTVSALTAFAGCAATALAMRRLPPDGAPSPGYGARWRYGLPLIALALASCMMAGADRFALQGFSGAALLGLYAAAYALGRQPVEIVANAINQGAFPELMKRFDQYGDAEAAKFAGQVGEMLLLLGLSTVTALWALAPALADMLLPDAYRASARSIIPLTAGAGLLFAAKSFVFDSIFHMYRRNWMQVLSYLPAALVTAAAAWLLVPRLGVTGAAWTAVAGAAAGLVSSILMTRPMLRIAVPGREVIRIIVMAAGAGLAATAVVNVLGNKAPWLLLAAGSAAYLAGWGFLGWMLPPAALRTVAARPKSADLTNPTPRA